MQKALKSYFTAVDEIGLHRFRLTFRDPELEHTYVDEVVRQWLPSIRLQTLIGIGAWVAFVPLDVVLLGKDAVKAIIIRTVVCSALYIVRLATFLPDAHRLVQSIMTIGLVIAGIGINILVALLDPPANYLYYGGLLMVIIYGANLQGLHYYVSGGIGVGLGLIYAVVAIWINPIETVYIINNLFFIGSTLTWTIWSSYRQEIYVRARFANHYLLRSEKRRTEELLVAAQAGNRAKTEFLAVMSHELRTPLNAIIGFSEIMRKQLFGPVGSDKYLSYIEDISDSGNHLLRVINDILDLSKAEAGKLEIREDEVDIHELIQHSLRMFREKANEAGLTIHCIQPEIQPVLWADSRLVRQVIINLVSNAVKFTPPGGTVSISTTITPEGACRVDVSDSGIGLAKADIPRVLQPFVQVESALARKNGGTGLGLPLVKRIIELHDGTFELSSELGVGTTASILFPKSRVVGTSTTTIAALAPVTHAVH